MLSIHIRPLIDTLFSGSQNAILPMCLEDELLKAAPHEDCRADVLSECKLRPNFRQMQQKFCRHASVGQPLCHCVTPPPLGEITYVKKFLRKMAKIGKQMRGKAISVLCAVVPYDTLAEKYDKVKNQLDTITEQISRKKLQHTEIQKFISTFQETLDVLTEFDADTWYALVDFATVYATGDIRFTFKNGQEI